MRKTILLLLLLLCGSYLGLSSPALAEPAAHASMEAEKAGVPVSPAAAVHHEEGLFSFNLGILISQTLNFLILMWILKTFLYAPLDKILKARQQHIQDDIHAAENQNRQAQELKATWDQRIGTVEQEAYQIKQKAISEANGARDQIVGEAKKTAADQLLKAEKEIHQQKQKAWMELREEVVKLSLSVAEKVIEKSLDDATHHEMIRKTIAQLEKGK